MNMTDHIIEEYRYLLYLQESIPEYPGTWAAADERFEFWRKWEAYYPKETDAAHEIIKSRQ